MQLQLTRPLAFFDLETTGINISQDRILEIFIIKLEADGSESRLRYLINPGMPIPPESTKIHGITNEMVQHQPHFKDIAKELLSFIDACDFAGFNSNRFDFPMLVEEFLRAEVNFDIENRMFVDVQRIFHTLEPRNLAAAYRFYCNKELTNAHSAEADTQATYEILLAQVERYQQLEPNIEYLHKFSGQTNFVDLAGRIIKNERQEPVFNFGKYKGRKVSEVFKQDSSYYDWMMKGDFPLQTKQVITRLRLQDFNKR